MGTQFRSTKGTQTIFSTQSGPADIICLMKGTACARMQASGACALPLPDHSGSGEWHECLHSLHYCPYPKWARDASELISQVIKS